MRQFAVIGLGNFGSTVARALARKDIPVVAIDRNPLKIDEIREDVTHAVAGDATDAGFLGSIGISEIDAAIVSLGDDIESSVLVTLNLVESGINEIVVKGVSEEHATILRAIGAHKVIFPEKEMAERLADSYAMPGVIENIPLTEGYNLVEISAPEPFYHKSIIELDLRREYGIELLAIKRDEPDAEPKIVVVPGASEIIKPGDKLFILGSKTDIELLENL